MIWGEVLGFAVAAFLLNLSPGPSLLFVASRGVAGGTRAGVFAALGLASGSALWAVLAGVGALTFVEQWPLGYTVLKWIGAAYLVYLAITGLRASKAMFVPTADGPPVSGRRSYFQGVLVEGSNPKTLAFFLALVPSLVEQMGSVNALSTIAVCLIVPATALPIDLTAGATAGRFAEALNARPNAARSLNVLASAILLALALWIVLR